MLNPTASLQVQDLVCEADKIVSALQEIKMLLETIRDLIEKDAHDKPGKEK